MADNDFKLQVLGATDLVALVSQSVSLKRRGKNYVGLCPFHQEKTPSFNVDPVKGYFRCFGCKESGNAIDFVMKRDRLDFLEALKLLAEKANLELPRFGVSKQKTSERQALLDLHSKAAEFYRRCLLAPIGAPAREYLRERGFSDETLERFKVGFAPPGWDNLLRSKEMVGVAPGLLALAGLVKAREGGSGHYDTFRHRILFPIRDEQSRTIAFGGRVMPPAASPQVPGGGGGGPTEPVSAAKYLNSPETPLFSKSRTIFGLDFARERIVETRTVAIVEGYTDVVMAHQYGATNVVSILGTAMTEQHLNTLRRFGDRIVLLFDGDSAGESAVSRSIELFLAQPIEIAIATLPEGLDPDEFLLRDGLAAFDTLLKTAEDALTFKWQMLEREVAAAGHSLVAQQKAVESFLALVASGAAGGSINELRWGQVLRRVERLTGIPIDQLSGRLRTLSRSALAKARSVADASVQAVQTRPNGGAARPGGGIGGGGVGGGGGGLTRTLSPQDRGREAGESAGVDGAFAQDLPDAATERMDPARARVERWILGILLAEPSRWIHVQREVSPEQFRDVGRRKLAELYWDRQRNEGQPEFSEFLGELTNSTLRELAVNLLEEAETLGDPGTTLREALRYFEEQRRRDQERNTVAALLSRKQEDETQLQMLRDLFARKQENGLRPRTPEADK